MLEAFHTAIPTGSTIGILGGGQLGRMTVLAAARLGYRCHIFTPEIDSPAAQVADKTTVASFEDKTALKLFSDQAELITYEFENIPIESALFLQKLKPVFPDPSILAISQHRGAEKRFATNNAIEVAEYELVTNQEELQNAVSAIKLPFILKTCRFGYDGKGQIKINRTEEIKEAWDMLSTDDAIVEKLIPFEKEISVIVARNIHGDLKAYPPMENRHKNHILDTTIAPAKISGKTNAKAIEIGKTLANSLKLVGLLAIEMFVLTDGKLLMNEIAPRPHNSGHWTQDGAVTCQFEQFIRAISGQVLGSTNIIHPTRMKNLIGHEINEWAEYLKHPTAKLHLYGKEEVKEGRKMGHINFLNDLES